MDSQPSTAQMLDLWKILDKFFSTVKSKTAQVSGEHWNRVHAKFNQIATYITSVSEIAGILFQNKMIDQKELEAVNSLDKTPIRAGTELLTTLIKKPESAYSCFLRALLSTKQQHIYQLLICEIEECDMEHSKVIRHNYGWLIDKLDSANGLITHLIANKVLTIREAADIDTKADPFKKNEALLSIVSKKDPKFYQEFLRGLDNTGQSHVRGQLEQRPQTTRNSMGGRSGSQTAIKVVDVEVQRRTPPKPAPKRPGCNSSQNTPPAIPIETKPKRTSTDSLSRIFSRLNDDLQASISMKVVTQKTKDSIVHSCITRTFENLEKLNFAPENEQTELMKLLHKTVRGGRDPTKNPETRRKGLIGVFPMDVAQSVVSENSTSNEQEQEFMKVKRELEGKIQQLEDSLKKFQNQEREIQKLYDELQQSNALVKELQKQHTDGSKLVEATQQLEISRNKILAYEKEINQLQERVNELLVTETQVGSLHRLESENGELKDMLKQSEDLKRSFEEANCMLQETIRSLKSELLVKTPAVKDNFRYIAEPFLEETFGRDDGQKWNGLSRLTILKEELYIVAQDFCRVDVYDVRKLTSKRKFSFKEVTNVEDIVSCPNNECLYIVFWNDEKSCEEIIWCDQSGKLLMKWLTGETQGRLSITQKSQLLFTVNDKHKLHEYSPDGRLMRKIPLHQSIRFPQHSLEFTEDQYVVSYGSKQRANASHGVCLVNSNAELLRSFVVPTSNQFRPLNLPVYLAVDSRSNILVADLNNHRVLLLDPELNFTKTLITEAQGLQFPRRICLDRLHGRLIVASGIAAPDGTGAGQVLVFKVGINEASKPN